MSNDILLPHDLLILIGNSDGWDILIRLALVNHEWYNYMMQYPWERIMPYHRSFNNNKDYNHMNMFSMLATLQTRTKQLTQYGLDTTQLELINGIPVMDTGYRTSTDMTFNDISQCKQFLMRQWKLMDITEKTFLKIRLATMPEAVTKLMLNNDLTITGETRNEKFLRFTPGSLNYNVVQSHLVFPYTGITDFYQEYDDSGKCKTLHLISNTTQYRLDIATRTETSRTELNYDGYKFFGFYRNSIVTVAMQNNSAIMVKTSNGWRQLDPLLLQMNDGYLTYGGNRLNITKLKWNRIGRRARRHGFEIVEIMEQLDEDDYFDPEFDMEFSLNHALTNGSRVIDCTKTIQRQLDPELNIPAELTNGPRYNVV